jgi:L-amino acid N-acyltransferase YncA
MIRLATADDAADVAEIYRPYVEKTSITFEVIPPTAEEMATRIVSTLLRYPWLVFEADGRVAGYAYAAAHRTREAYQWSVDAAVYVRENSHRQGVGRQLYGALFPLLVRQGFVNAYAGITVPNAKSIGLHEAMGFTPVGIYHNVGYKLGHWHAVTWWHLQLQPLSETPAVPVPLPDLQG